jgi:hypothetical protein
MAYQSHHCSATLPCSVCLSVFLHTVLCFLFFFLLCSVRHVLPCTIPLLCISVAALCLLLHMSITLNGNNHHLFFILHTYSLCAPCACNMRNASACSHHANVLHIGVFTATPPIHQLHSLEHQHPLSVLHLLLMSSALPHHHATLSFSGG